MRLVKDMDLEALEQTTGVSARRLLNYNDVNTGKKPKAEELWYLRSKRSKAREAYHIAQEGEDLWTISQKYGIRLSQLRKKNHIDKRQDTVKPGRVLWLQSTRPEDEQIAFVSGATSKEAPSPPADESQTANISPASKPSKSTYSGQILHEVQPGETLYSISKKYGVTMDELLSWNDLPEAGVLSVGQQIMIQQSDLPGGQSAASEEAGPGFETYKVKAGDTLYQIAREHGTSIKELMEWNRKSDSNLSIGEELKVRKLP